MKLQIPWNAKNFLTSWETTNSIIRTLFFTSYSGYTFSHSRNLVSVPCSGNSIYQDATLCAQYTTELLKPWHSKFLKMVSPILSATTSNGLVYVSSWLWARVAMYLLNDNTRSSAVSPVRSVTLCQWSLYLTSRIALPVCTKFCKSTNTRHRCCTVTKHAFGTDQCNYMNGNKNNDSGQIMTTTWIKHHNYSSPILSCISLKRNCVK